MAVPFVVEIVSDEQLSNAVSHYGALIALTQVVDVEWPAAPEVHDALAVELTIGGDVIVARVAAVIGGGAMLEYSEHSPSVDDEIISLFVAVRHRRDAEHRDKWEVSKTVRSGDGSIDKFNKAAREAARYIFA